jgi:hypothetical protein
VGLGRHLGDGILYVGAAVTGAPLWRNRCRAVGWGGRRGRWLGRLFVLSHHTLLMYLYGRRWTFRGMYCQIGPGLWKAAIREVSSGGKYMIFLH